MKRSKTLDARSGSGMTEEGISLALLFPSSLRTRGSSVFLLHTGGKAKTLDSRLQTSGMTDRGKTNDPGSPIGAGDDRGRNHPCPSLSVILANARIQRLCSCFCLSSLRTRGSSVFLFTDTGKSKDAGSRIKSGMTDKRKSRFFTSFRMTEGEAGMTGEGVRDGGKGRQGLVSDQWN